MKLVKKICCSSEIDMGVALSEIFSAALSLLNLLEVV
jgi:hypothetical protein